MPYWYSEDLLERQLTTECDGQAGESADPGLIAMTDRNPVFAKSKRCLDLLEIYDIIVSTR